MRHYRIMKTLVTLAAVLLVLPLSAQERQRRTRIDPPPNGNSVEAPEGSRPLEKNITIHLGGTTGQGGAVDLSLTGTGPTFLSDEFLGGDGSTVNLEIIVKATEKGYILTYLMGTRLKIADEGEGKPQSYTYRDFVTRGSVFCLPGKAVEIVKNGEKSISLTVSEAAE